MDGRLAKGEANNSEQLMKHNDALRDNFASVWYIKNGIEHGELSEAKEAWFELEEDVQRALWMAPSKGGILSTVERTMIKSNEWHAA